MPRTKKVKQKQKQKQSQRIIVNIDNSRKTVRRRDHNPPQPRSHQPSIISIPYPVFNQPQQTFSDNSFQNGFKEINNRLNNLSDQFNTHATNITNRMMTQQPQSQPQYTPYTSAETPGTVPQKIPEKSIPTLPFTSPVLNLDKNVFNEPNTEHSTGKQFGNSFAEHYQDQIYALDTNKPEQIEIKKVDQENKKSNKQDDLMQGKYANEAERLVCPICGQWVSTVSNVNRHLREYHISTDNSKGTKKTTRGDVYSTLPRQEIENIIMHRNEKGTAKRVESLEKARASKAEKYKPVSKSGPG